MERNQVAPQQASVAPAAHLFVSLELANEKWRVMASDGSTRVRQYSVEAGDGAAVLGVIERARRRFGLAADAGVLSCYEAGRDGFWLHRFLLKNGVRNLIVDPSSIEVNRRKRRAKTDRIDGRKLLGDLLRFVGGQKDCWSVLRVPSETEEDARRPHRERERLVDERRAHVSRIKDLLITQNVRIDNVGGRGWQKALAALDLPAKLRAELQRETDRLALVNRQIAQLQREHAQELATSNDEASGKEHRLQRLRAIGQVGAWTLVREAFGWRHFNNRRELAASVGLCGSPYNSGAMEREQGITKAGNARVRTLMVELAWQWLRLQPISALSKWYMERFGRNGGRPRRIGIVALARRLLIALWRFVEHGVIPEGARLKAA